MKASLQSTFPKINKLKGTFNHDSVSPMKSALTQNWKRDLLFAWFITCMVIVNTLGSKVTVIAGLRVSVGIFFMPFMFLITDIISEVFGNDEAQHFVNMSIPMLRC